MKISGFSVFQDESNENKKTKRFHFHLRFQLALQVMLATKRHHVHGQQAHLVQ